MVPYAGSKAVRRGDSAEAGHCPLAFVAARKGMGAPPSADDPAGRRIHAPYPGSGGVTRSLA